MIKLYCRFKPFFPIRINLDINFLFLHKATFHESGFSYEDYPIELAWTLRTSSSGAAGIGSVKSRMSGGEKKTK